MTAATVPNTTVVGDDQEQMAGGLINDPAFGDDAIGGFFSLSLDLLCVAGSDGFFKRVNPAWEAALGYTTEELLSIPFLDLIHPDDVESTQEEVAKIGAGAKTIGFTNRYAKKDGSYLFLEWSAAPALADGLIFAVARDITQQHLTLEALEQRTSLQRAIFDSANYMIISTDLEGTIQLFNAAAARLLGYEAEELVGKSSPALLHLPDEVVARASELTKDLGIPIKPGFEVFVAKARAGVADENEWTYVRKDGTQFPVQLSVTGLRNDAGTLTGFLGVGFDISERRQAHQKLEAQRLESKELTDDIEKIMNTVVDGLIVIDDKGTIETCNEACVNLFQYDKEELVGQNVKVLMPQRYSSEHDSYLRNYSRTRQAKIIGIGREVTGMRSDGSDFPMELSVGEMKSDRRSRYVGIIRDISERKQNDEMKNEFISTVSHELRTPLTSIKGSLGLIRAGVTGDLPPKLERMLDIAYNNSDRLVRLINDILDIEKISSGKTRLKLEEINLSSLIQDAMSSIEGFALGHEVSCVSSIEGDDVKIEGDSSRLLQVMNNLLSNAIKYSSEGGVVEVSVSSDPSSVRIAVKDAGGGIPEEFRGRIFSRFAQADSSDTRERGGTGLGLSIAKAIVETHKGSIGFESEIGVGTTFYFDLPRYKSDTDKGQIGSRSHLNRILIVEDDPDVGEVLSAMIEKEGFCVDIARTATEAKGLLRAGVYLAMTLDLSLPDQNGIPLIFDLRRDPDTAAVPIVVVSANADDARSSVHDELAEVVGWLQKPVSEENLAHILRKAIGLGDRLVRILHVEDDNDVLDVVCHVLDGLAITVPARTLQEAKGILRRDTSFDLVLLDMNLPDGKGEELLPALRNKDGEAIPVVVFSAEEQGREAPRSGEIRLVKSRTSNNELVASIKQVLKRGELSDQTIDRLAG